MGSKYSSQSSSGYNASPPVDDGTATEANKVKWSTIKTKLSDVLKTFIEAVNTSLVTALDQSCRTVTASDNAAATDHNRTLQVTTSSVTLTLADATTMATGYIVSVSNQSSGDITVALATATDTIDGVTNTTQVIGTKETRRYVVNTAATGYLTASNGARPNSAFTTGDVKITIKTTADSGWVLMDDGTIGNASSGGTTRANADTEALYTLLWNNTSNTDCAVSTGRGASAAADFAANKTIALPKALGRALAVYGAGSTLTSRAMGAIVGTETHTLTNNELPTSAHTHTSNSKGNDSVAQGGDETVVGGGAAHNNMQPSVFLNVMIKL